MFDFAFVFEKPVMYADKEVDISVYDASWLDEPVWQHTVADQIGKSVDFDSVDSLSNTINDVLNDASLRESGKKLKEQVWANVGDASEHVYEYIQKRLIK